MKSKWLILTKVQLAGMFDFNRARHSNDAKVARRTAGSAVILAVIALLIGIYSVMFSIGFCSQGMGVHLPAFLIAITSVIIWVFSLLRGCSAMFAMNDYDHVMSLPVKKSDILASRFLCVYLANVALAVPFIIPGVAVLFAMDGFSFAVLAISLVSMLLAPLLPMAVAITLSTLLTAITARFRYKNILQIVLSVVLFVGVMVASFSVSFNTSASGGDMDMNAVYAVMVGNVYLPAMLVDISLTGAVWGIFAFAGISLAAMAVFAVAYVLCFERVHTALSAHSAGVGYSRGSVRSSTVFSALVKREFRRLFSSAAYFINALSGTIVLIIAAIALIVFDPAALFAEGAETFPVSLFAYCGAGVALMFVGMSNPAASALSLEGKSREQLFVLPLSVRQIMLAKIAPTFFINTPVALAFAVVFCIRFEADPVCWAVTLVSVVIFCAFCALFGGFLNLKLPKYDWTNPAMVAKNSMPVMISVLGSMVVGIACAVLGVIFGLWVYVAADVIALALSVAIFTSFSRKDSFTM